METVELKPGWLRREIDRTRQEVSRWPQEWKDAAGLDRKKSGRDRRGYFMIGVWHPKVENNIGTLFRSATCFGGSGVFTVGRRYRPQASDTTAAYRHMPLFHYDDLDSMIKHMPYDCMLVGVELDDRAISLPKFSHPERACYLLGAEDHGLSEEVRRRCHSLVTIPGASRCLNVSVAGSLVLYDRTCKRM